MNKGKDQGSVLSWILLELYFTFTYLKSFRSVCAAEALRTSRVASDGCFLPAAYGSAESVRCCVGCSLLAEDVTQPSALTPEWRCSCTGSTASSPRGSQSAITSAKLVNRPLSRVGRVPGSGGLLQPASSESDPRSSERKLAPVAPCEKRALAAMLVGRALACVRISTERPSLRRERERAGGGREGLRMGPGVPVRRGGCSPCH